MAQALFDEHPLGDYLRDHGETPLLIPGICPTLEQELVDFNINNTSIEEHSDADEDHKKWPPRALLDFIEFLQTVISSVQADTPSPFVEKFKYNVISSSLLSPSLPTLHSRRSSKSLSIPGKLLHSRASSMDIDHDIPITPVPPSEPSYGMITLSTASVVALFATGYPLLALIALTVTLLLVYNFLSTTDSHQSDMTPSFNALDELIQANQIWESVVQDAVSLLESNERTSLLHSPANSPITPSQVRVALHSCLQTTHIQCDNIRNIFSALTSPAELSQLSEMYAQSPSTAGFNPDLSSRPFSFPQSHSKTSPDVFTTPDSKRNTWSGSYTSLASAGSPTHSINRRRDRRRTGIPDLFGSSPISAPTTPEVIISRDNISDIPEFDPSMEEETMANPSLTSSESNHFGVAALELQRKRRSGGLETLRTFTTAYHPSNQSSRDARNSTFVSPTPKFTSLQPARHPLSLSALKHAVQCAIAAKRYTCSHLLALRFSDEEDEGYWEDVRSVMGLLTSTFADASSRLSEALDEAEEQRLQDQSPIPPPVLLSSEDETIFGIQQNPSYKPFKIDARVSFAPMPNHISRFAAHVAAIGSALDDARDHLEQCVSALKEDSSPTSSISGSWQRSQRSRNFSKIPVSAPKAETEVPMALQAYERLRRELGLALRECERGRDRLLEIVNPLAPSDEEEFDDLPSLGHDLSDDSDKTDPVSPPPDDESDVAALIHAGKGSTTMVGSDTGGTLIDDATSHLLLTATTKHLPMPGIEEVFEADMGTKAVFSRERPKLTREERIKAAKARRESGLGLGIAFGGGADGDGHIEPQKVGGIEKWGPGGEVVQELKDVIWKVSEKRRKMADAQALNPS
ncbi:hypothetical protein BYT27DRAFT_7338887 [Phlegmacium glaucopus]|nr:hypothetical protein BYT27DRAFT_7338887 [Phlegmacium glaucopus]